MCGRFTLTKKQKLIEERFEAEAEAVIKEIFNAAPTRPLPVVANNKPDRIQHFRWGLIPQWAKDAKIGSKMINARAETLHEKPAYKKLLSRKRCLVIADGFYEWKKTSSGPQPYRITLKNEALFSFAGLWDEWVSGDGEVIDSFSIITTEANDLMKKIHDRMPVILKKEDEKKWLDAGLSADDAKVLLQPYEPIEMKAYPVSKAVNAAGNNSPDLILPVEPEKDTTLF